MMFCNFQRKPLEFSFRFRRDIPRNKQTEWKSIFIVLRLIKADLDENETKIQAVFAESYRTSSAIREKYSKISFS